MDHRLVGLRVSVGVYGSVCGAKSLDYLVSTKGHHVTTRRAKCNRWAEHSDDHMERDPKTFRVLAQWSAAQTATPED